MAGKTPYSKLGQMLENARKKKENQQKLATLNRKTPASMSAYNESGYIRENGLDRQDAKLRRENRAAFRNQVDSMIRKNEGELLKKGKIYTNYALARANERSKKK